MHVTVWFDYFELCMPDLFSVLVQYQTVLLAVKQIHEQNLFVLESNILTR